jgi:hypothetical protein
MAVRNVAHPSVDDRMATGGQARERTPPTGHAGWVPAADRPDPVALLEEQNLTREKDLVPVRHGRMMASPFTFYRGAAKIMAADLKDTPVAGLDVQLCGDAHLSNFGAFASPERAHVLRTHLRVDAGAGPRPVWGPSRHCGVPGHERCVRHGDHRLLPAVLGSERAGLSAVRDGDPIRSAGSTRGCLSSAAEDADRIARLDRPLHHLPRASRR